MATILYVEDDGNNVEIVTRLLSRKSHDVIVAGAADEALTTAREHQPNLILMDMGIPETAGGDASFHVGLKATRDLKTDAATANIPVLALTASTMAIEKQAMRDAGCDGVAGKPFVFAELFAEVERLLG